MTRIILCKLGNDPGLPGNQSSPWMPWLSTKPLRLTVWHIKNQIVNVQFRSCAELFTQSYYQCMLYSDDLYAVSAKRPWWTSLSTRSLRVNTRRRSVPISSQKKSRLTTELLRCRFAIMSHVILNVFFGVTGVFHSSLLLRYLSLVTVYLCLL